MLPKTRPRKNRKMLFSILAIIAYIKDTCMLSRAFMSNNLRETFQSFILSIPVTLTIFEAHFRTAFFFLHTYHLSLIVKLHIKSIKQFLHYRVSNINTHKLLHLSIIKEALK